MKTKIIFSLLFLVLLTSAITLMADDILTTNIWVNYGSLNSTLNSLPIPTHTVVNAFDPQGVNCGRQYASEPGTYPWLAVYGDDPESPVVDEGCIVNDVVDFTINGIPAQKLGPGTDIWSGIFGTGLIMDLAVSQTFGVDVDGPPEQLGTEGDIITYSVTITNTGNGIDLDSIEVTADAGWDIVSVDFDVLDYDNTLPDGETYIPAGAQVTVTIDQQIPTKADVPGDGDFDSSEVTITVQSQFDDATSDDHKITIIRDITADVNDADYILPGVFTLKQNYPNPFNPETQIQFNLERSADITLKVYNILGQKINTLYEGFLSAGEHQMKWNGTDDNGAAVVSGIYFYRIVSGEYTLTRKMTLLK